MRVGLISDTHGLLRPEALDALAGCERLLHAGDIGDPTILEQLAALAPVDAVRGNNDTDAWATSIPERLRLNIESVELRLLHDLADWGGAQAEPARVVVTGHSHRPAIVERDGVCCINPGSAGPRRFSLPVSVAILEFAAGEIRDARIVELSVAPPRKRPGHQPRRAK